MAAPPPSRPPAWAVALLTVLVVLAGFLVLRWIAGTISFLLNTLVVVAVLAAAGYLYLRTRR